jgi:hypothetical protein
VTRAGEPDIRAALERRSFGTVQAAIKLNEVEVQEVELTGVLVTVSITKKAELRTDDPGNVALDVRASTGCTDYAWPRLIQVPRRRPGTLQPPIQRTDPPARPVAGSRSTAA